MEKTRLQTQNQIDRTTRPSPAARWTLRALAHSLLAVLVLAGASCGPSQKELERRIASTRAELAATLGGEGEASSARGVIAQSRGWTALQEFYGGEEPELVWVDGEGPRERGDELIALLGGGVPEADGDEAEAAEVVDAYGVARLVELRDAARRAVEEKSEDLGRRLADFELAASYAFLTRAFHTIEGRVDPTSLNVQWFTEGRKAEPLKLLAQVRDGAAPADVLEDLEPTHEGYRLLLEARERYRAVVAAGGWPQVPTEGPALEEGARGPRVAALRERLTAEGDLPRSPEASGSGGAVYDAALAEAVRRFQARNGLEADGKIGSDTVEALNVPAEERLRTVELNLERWRWMPGTFGDHFVEVNIPEYRLRVIRDGERQLQMRVIVGKRLNETPVFSDTMSYIVLNPEWNIPESIADSEVVPKIVSNPGYAQAEGIEVVTPGGQRVPASSVLGRQRRSWGGRDGEETAVEDEVEVEEADRGGGFFDRLFGRDDDDTRGTESDDRGGWGYTVVTELPEGHRLRQKPGPDNPLGRVKFMFPNEHNIYLHDTPAGNLFESTDRGFSHGCIRLEKPFELADYVLRGSGDWPPERIRRVVESGERTEIPLPEKLPVHLTYFTAWTDSEGRTHFRPDLYGHDGRLAQALATEEPLTLDPPALRGEAPAQRERR